MQTPDDMPQRLREARLRTGMSLRQLAQRLDISASALSQIETGKSRPSVRTLYAVVSELGLSLDELFAADGPSQAPVPPPAPAAPTHVDGGGNGAADGSAQLVQRAAERPRIELDGGVTWERLTAHHDANVDFLFVTYPPGSTSNAHGRLVRHAGTEYGIVLAGVLDVTVGFDTYRLMPQDSISFSSHDPHVLANRGADPALAIWFVVGRRGSDARDLRFPTAVAGVTD